ncbi:MAG: FtsX-like permease family protein [Candidatus Azobacteroides sp.]|nr:FtsX-like permease family protein [Candidatus Azobacteroides sp.]
MESGGSFYSYGLIAALILFLFIPAMNIMALTIANTNIRAEEIAIRRTFGASRISSFFQIIMENLFLVALGAVIGLTFAIPAMNIIQRNVMNNSFMEGLSLIDHIDYQVIFLGVLPAIFIFSLLSGGLPAYLISKHSIAKVLKGI